MILVFYLQIHLRSSKTLTILFLLLLPFVFYCFSNLLTQSSTNLHLDAVINSRRLENLAKTKQMGNTRRSSSSVRTFSEDIRNSSEVPTFHLVTYNLWGHYFVGNFNNYEERFEAFAESMKDFDIVLVQEIFLLRVGPFLFTKYAETLVRVMEARGFRYKGGLRESLPTFFGQTSGVVIFSRIPVRSTKWGIFRDWGWSEASTNKGFVYVEIVLKEHTPALCVFNVHLDAHRADIRERQLRQVLGTIEKLPKHSPTVIGGDFNFDSPNETTSLSSKEYQKLRQNMARENLRVVFPERPVTFAKGRGNTDQICVSANLGIKSKKIVKLYTKTGESVSDHYGLAVELELFS